ncbi:hypothetical protein JN06_00531 [Bacteroides zoogleoformans]|nr:hypothetical protein [Bacteroides zoogleoformans]TWJ17956.1 hypothetical protein JN06_00531 [Bacteroides zoogleoformans]
MKKIILTIFAIAAVSTTACAQKEIKNNQTMNVMETLDRKW